APRQVIRIDVREPDHACVHGYSPRSPVSRTYSGSRSLRARVFLRRARLELEADESLVAYHPPVMARFDHVSVARPDVGLGSVLVRDVEPAGLSDTHVPDLAAVGAHDRLGAPRPPPARLERHARSGRAPNANHIDACLVGRPRLVRGVDIQRLYTSHP